MSWGLLLIEPRVSFSIDELSTEIIDFLDLRIVGYESSISKLPNTLDVELFSRITLTENEDINLKNIKKHVSNNRYNHHFLVIEAFSAGLASFAARDGRVDAIRISPLSKLKIFNTRYGRRLEEGDKLVEIDISCMFERNFAKNLRPILRILQAFTKCDLKYVLSTNPQNLMHLRSYRGIQSIGRIIGLSNRQTSPGLLLDRLEVNKKKLQGKIPFPGVELE